MPAALRITLTEDEASTLQDLRQSPAAPQRTRDRAHLIYLNAQGWNAPALAEIFDCCEHTVRATLKRWQDNGVNGLWDASGRGSKRRWHVCDLEYLEQCLEEDARTYTSEQLAQKLAQERNVTLSADRLRRLLKKRAGGGNERATASRTNKTRLPKPSSKRTSSA
ncbi:hypothetical protein C1752_18692 [Acaryochloris thomasi RCC1774]|uniref:Transposase n=1 Tax=Acaryochloris thomasi RCC1774 TaxID=1764569 RepID=A0A2W1JEF8_9CYAN|nr:hypothetical protein C1752_18692 [Acaryochloris thomasi RCC1774]